MGEEESIGAREVGEVRECKSRGGWGRKRVRTSIEQAMSAHRSTALSMMVNRSAGCLGPRSISSVRPPVKSTIASDGEPDLSASYEPNSLRAACTSSCTLRALVNTEQYRRERRVLGVGLLEQSGPELVRLVRVHVRQLILVSG